MIGAGRQQACPGEGLSEPIASPSALGLNMLIILGY
jgi:hypothetical protein